MLLKYLIGIRSCMFCIFPNKNPFYGLKFSSCCLHGMYAVKYGRSCYKICTPENPEKVNNFKGKNLTLVSYLKNGKKHEKVP